MPLRRLIMGVAGSKYWDPVSVNVVDKHGPDSNYKEIADKYFSNRVRKEITTREDERLTTTTISYLVVFIFF